MPTSRSILFVIMTLCLTVLIAPGLHAYPPTTLEYSGLSAVAVDRVNPNDSVVIDNGVMNVTSGN
jgi:hypothetical protein